MPDYDPFDPGPIRPLGAVHQLLLISSGMNYQPYQITYIEPIPPGGREGQDGASVVDLSDGNGIAASVGLAAREIAEVAVSENELLHLRFFCLDDTIEVRMWYPRGVQRMRSSRNIRAYVTAASRLLDPHDALSTFFVFGYNVNPFMEVSNASTTAIVQARVVFYGFRYNVEDAKHIGSVDDLGRLVANEPGRDGRPVFLPATRVPVIEPRAATGVRRG